MPSHPPQHPDRNAERARHAFAAMQRHLHLGSGVRLYRESVPTASGGNPFAFLWPFEEAAKATLCLRGMPGEPWRDVEDVVERLAYWQPRRSTGLLKKPSYASYPPMPLGQGGDTYFDDNTWVALDLLQAYRMADAFTGKGPMGHLERARQILDLVAAAWCQDRRPYPGGVYWVDAAWNRDRGCAVTAGLAVLALQLRELAPECARPTLEIAARAYEWLRQTLWIERGPLAGLYHDKVLGEGGAIDETQWIYNQGVPIAAGVMLHRATGEGHYLDDAIATADAALRYYGEQRYAGQPAIFVAIFFRNLLWLDALAPDPAYRAAMQAYADAAWENPAIRDRATGLFRFDPRQHEHTLLDQAAMVQIYALLAWPREQYPLLA